MRGLKDRRYFAAARRAARLAAGLVPADGSGRDLVACGFRRGSAFGGGTAAAHCEADLPGAPLFVSSRRWRAGGGRGEAARASPTASSTRRSTTAMCVRRVLRTPAAARCGGDGDRDLAEPVPRGQAGRVRAGVVNGRISDRALPRYRRAGVVFPARCWPGPTPSWRRPSQRRSALSGTRRAGRPRDGRRQSEVRLRARAARVPPAIREIARSGGAAADLDRRQHHAARARPATRTKMKR